jgi:hypothetical protein
MLQGNFYDSRAAQVAPGDRNADGQNLIGRWTQLLPGGSDFRVQMYWDRTRRQIPNSITEVLNIYDIEFDHRFVLGERHKFVWGGGYSLYARRRYESHDVRLSTGAARPASLQRILAGSNHAAARSIVSHSRL